MIRWRWIPVKYLIRRAARAYGLIDPLTFLARMRSFSQPSEVKEPMELVRAGILFQARGVINARAIQFNLDWVWPFWVERQFNPSSPSFIPRGYAPTHVNLTHRNWTAVGLPGLPLYPLVDPNGLVTPLYDGWSLDFAFITVEGEKLFPSRLDHVEQKLCLDKELAVQTIVDKNGHRLTSLVRMIVHEGQPLLNISLTARSDTGGRLAVSLRPYNPEGIQFVEKIRLLPGSLGFLVDETPVLFDRKPDRFALSNYARGDVLTVPETFNGDKIECPIGMATAAAEFNCQPAGTVSVDLTVALTPDLQKHFKGVEVNPLTWPEALADTPQLEMADERLCFLFEAAKRTLMMLSAHEIYPGPFTYRRFWFRDAALMGNALLGLNRADRLGFHVARLPNRQKRDGYFESQEGEWDSNGQALWMINRWSRCSDTIPDKSLLRSIVLGADWIIDKRMERKTDPLLGGLLPAGFSAEHLGPNDYYYWDDFWGIAGLRSAAELLWRAGNSVQAEIYLKQAADFEQAVFRSIEAIPPSRSRGCIPASPLRRLDAGAIGSLVADYPLQLTPAGDQRIMNTLDFIYRHCFYRGGFFQDMIHSGVNIYLTLDLAQTLLRAEDNRFADLMQKAAELATPTGNWPEAIHPFSGGGCMGDGQHGWAAAEWIMMIRSLFVREEGETLVFGSGLLPQWLGESTVFGPTATPHGPVSVNFYRDAGGVSAHINGRWHSQQPELKIALPGFQPADNIRAETTVPLKPL